jgi:8-oxo-dGTP pyrophosphatase MutT (NUDIX family)
MSKSGYMEGLRKKVGSDLILVPGVAAIIRDEAGRILLQRNKEGVWNLPAGAIDPGESPAKAVVREVFEETGLTAKPTRVLGVLGGAPENRITYENGDLVDSTTIVFECAVEGELKPQDDETATLKYFAIADMPELAIKYPPEVLSADTKETYFEPADR